MTYTDPQEWPVALLADAAAMNEQVRDNLNHVRHTAGGQVPATVPVRRFRSSTQTLTATRTYYGRVHGGGSVSVSSIHFEVSTSTGNVSVATYDTSSTARSAVPNSRQATSGAVACPATGGGSVSLGSTVTVVTGQSWFALSCSGAPVLVGTQTPASSNMGSGIAYQQSTHPAPSTAGTLTAIVGCPLLVGY